MSVAQVETYLDLVQSGYLVGRRGQVYDILKDKPMILPEICKKLNLPINSVSGRVTELFNRGLLEIVGEKKNPFSGKQNSLYFVKQLNLFS